MAVVAPAAIPQQATAMRFRELRIPGMAMTTSASSASREEIVEVGPVARVMEEEKVYVAVGKSVKECKSLVLWALQNSGGKRMCMVHVHQPAQMIPLLGAKFLASALTEQQVRVFREIERQEMHKVLDQYILLCRTNGGRAEKLFIESESIENGILELISKHKIRKLVMGAAADKSYKRGMTDIKSKKAISVRQQAPPYCHLQFICKEHLICNREASADGPNPEVGSSSQQASPSAEDGHPKPLRSQSMMPQLNASINPTNPAQYPFRRAKSVNVDGHGRRTISSNSLNDASALSTPRSSSAADGNFGEFEEISRRSTSQNSVFSSCFSSGMANGAVIQLTTEGDEFGTDFSTLPQDIEDPPHLTPATVLDENMADPLFDQLERALLEAMNSRREAFEEAVRRAKAEKDAVDAIRKAKTLENLYAEESKQRKDIQEALVKEKEELDKMKNERDRIMEELQKALDQKSSLERQIEESDEGVKEQELEQKINSAVELLQNYKKEQDELQIERDNALKEAEELRKGQAEASSSAHQSQFFAEFSFSEIEEATLNFDSSLKIGEGGYGNIYKCLLRHTPVAIKMLHPHSRQGPSEFQQEVDVLSKMRHPNIVTLVGACPAAWALIYEYLPRGSLEDRLSCRDDSPPLSWQTRIRIATELCSALIFLHSNKKHSIVHGDLKPGNILLDANLVSKLSDFGICRLLYPTATSSNNTTICCITNPKGTPGYIDPEFFSSGELTPKSDVYSFGIILLRLLTGRSALGIAKEVRNALDRGNLKNLLDPLAGDWPFVLAEKLANLALRCCEMNRKNRPDLASEVWRVLEPMKASCGGSTCFQLGSEDQCLPPPYFICPIFQEVMQDPHVAADGFTYEAEALRGWLDSGHDTSPLTNLKLAHCDLVPNRALRLAIQEWRQHR